MSFEPSDLETSRFLDTLRRSSYRFWRCLTFRPLTINTGPRPRDPAYDRTDRIDHAYVDLFVETCRASPYISGHIYALLLVAALVGVVVDAAT